MNRYPSIIRYVFIFIIYGTHIIVVVAQNTYIGHAQQGISGTDRVAFRNLGGVAEIRADMGVSTNVEGVVTTWNDNSGNGYNFVPSGPLATKPTFIGSYTTNLFPAVYFSRATTQRLTCYPLAQLFTGSAKPYTIITVLNSQNNNINHMAVAFGWTGATNTSASMIALRPNGNTVDTRAHAQAYDTNSAIIQIVVTSGTTTNCYGIVTMMNTGTNYTILDGLRLGTVSTSFAAQRTLDTASIGCLVRGGNNGVNAWEGGMSYVSWYTNSLTGNALTNEILRINNDFKTFNPP